MGFSIKIAGLVCGIVGFCSTAFGREEAILLGVGDTSSVGISSNMLASKVTSSDPLILEVKRSETGLIARALRPGAGFITIHSKSKVKQIDFAVKPYAAIIPGEIVATVSGKPAISGTVQGSIEGSIKQQLKFAPLSKLSMKFSNVPSVGPGMSLRVPVKIQVTAPGTIPKSGTLTVLVSNLGLMPKSEDMLWYCNDPERVTKKENLFAAELEAEKSARMLYHHINDTPRMMIVRTLVINNSDSEVKVCLTPGDSAPTMDPVSAGLRAGDLFLRSWISDSGEVVTIPPRSCIPLSCRKLKPKAVISGLCSIRHVGGTSKLLVRTDSMGVDDLEPRWQLAVSSSTPWREVGALANRSWDMSNYNISEHVYPTPFQSVTADFTVGGRFSVTRIGQRSIARQDSSGRLDGNFGVIYEISATISNSQAVDSDVEVVFEPSAGYSGAIFQIDDRYVITPRILPKNEARIAKYRLKAGEIRKLKILTVPLSGSSYPASLFIRMVGSGSTKAIIDLSNL